MVEMLARREEDFPGVLFLSPGVAQGDLRLALEVLERWVERHRRGEAEVKGTFGWLR